jgi:matrix metalloproteinase-14 (membrane-inserted)
LDAAFVWGGNGKIYFIKDSNYYKFDPTRKIPVGSDYPKDLQNWGLGPGKVDTAVKWVNKYTYFFKDGQYYR